ncbi:MAG: hypothetical protein ACO331_15990 [Prochlorothrix sp.]
MRILVIAEDYRRDQYILKPILAAMLAKLGKPKAKIEFCRQPAIQGISQALNGEMLAKVIDQHRGMVDLFLLCVDRDGNPNRRSLLDTLEHHTTDFLQPTQQLLAENAWQELEVWALAGQMDLPAEWQWQAVRQEPHPKETYFYPYLAQRSDLPLGDIPKLKHLGQEAGRRYDRVRQLCPEDVQHLESRIAAQIKPGS